MGRAMATITGDNTDNHLVGTADEDWVFGNDGNDTLEGLGGRDFLYGGLGNDLIMGGDGDDYLSAGTGTAMPGLEDGVERLFGNAGNDSLVCVLGGAGIYNGGAGIDYFELRVFGDISIELDFSIAGATHMLPNGATVTACEGLIFDGGNGNDSVVGGSPDDYLNGSGGADNLNGGGGDDRLLGSIGDDSLTGGDGDDFLDGDLGIDTLSGGLGNDELVWREGDSRLERWDGGDGIDTLAVFGGTTPLFCDVGRGLGLHGLVLKSIERIAGFSSFSTGNDTVFGGIYDDSFRGSDGDDRLSGGGGNDTIWGDRGFDTIGGGDGNDSLFANVPGRIREFLPNSLNGGGGNDGLFGSAGNDTLNGGSGDDTISGESGRDLLLFDLAGAVSIDLMAGTAIGQGTDSLLSIEDIRGSRDADTISANNQANMLDGGAGNDSLFGFGSNDTLLGGTGNDSLSGGNANDILSGDLGSDVLSGGTGADVFDFNRLEEARPSLARDTIADFISLQGDKIDFSSIDADTIADGDQAFTFIGTADFSGKAGELRYIVRQGNAFVFADADGDGLADMSIHLLKVRAILESDFVL
jgi:Ca2+-binding RTX toxin-like protein